MEANPSPQSLPIEIPIWKKPWFWILAAGVAGCFGLVILGLLVTFLVPDPHYASRSKAKADIVAIRNAVTEYAVANGGKFPDSLQALVAPDVQGHTYLNATSVPKDPWGRVYVYDPPGPGNPQPVIRSYGKDGRPGGQGDDADLDSASADARN